MPRNDPPDVKKQKTLAVLRVVNLVLTPLFSIDPALALTAALVVNGLLIVRLEEKGRERRPGSNMITEYINFSNTFFPAHTSGIAKKFADENTLRNIINGGGALYDDAVECLQGLKR